ncbi:hypothetical protein B0H16DRAFT_1453147 [Mycena metata]|uniref:Uncharacterized protein n=1 Tax=Mycena metata TaxID=1033252 RepID=A0AAD7NNF8_9AGAR|nr:hypothetical protein B0H16DRAFT_1453147 [Mycena metata]
MRVGEWEWGRAVWCHWWVKGGERGCCLGESEGRVHAALAGISSWVVASGTGQPMRGRWLVAKEPEWEGEPVARKLQVAQEVLRKIKLDKQGNVGRCFPWRRGGDRDVMGENVACGRRAGFPSVGAGLGGIVDGGHRHPRPDPKVQRGGGRAGWAVSWRHGLGGLGRAKRRGHAFCYRKNAVANFSRKTSRGLLPQECGSKFGRAKGVQFGKKDANLAWIRYNTDRIQKRNNPSRTVGRSGVGIMGSIREVDG